MSEDLEAMKTELKEITDGRNELETYYHRQMFCLRNREAELIQGIMAIEGDRRKYRVVK